jgi:TolA-binding protein
MKNTFIALIFITALFQSCKTREDIAQEKLVTNINNQVQDSQKLNADFIVRLQEVETRLTDLNGKTEEGQHHAEQTLNEQLKGLQERLTVLETTQKDLQEKAERQEQYTAEVLKNLKMITGKGSSRKGTKKLSDYDQAMKDYKRGRYKSSAILLQKLLKSKKVTGKRKARVMHNLGVISYLNKNNQDSLTYFSKLFMEMPKSGYNKSGLLFLGKTFKRMNKKEEMKQTLNELITRWPKAKQVNEAKKLMK